MIDEKSREKILKLLLVRLVNYLEGIHGFSLYKYQKKEAYHILRAVILGTGAEITQLWARQSGKTDMGRSLIMTMMAFLPSMGADKSIVSIFPQLEFYKDGFEVGLVAPKLDSAAIPLNRIKRDLDKTNMKKNLAALGINAEVCNSKTLIFNNGSRATAMSGKETSFNEGESLHYLHFEEAQKLSQFTMYKTFHPMMASTAGCSIKVGTTAMVRGAFYNIIQRNKRDHPHWHGEYPWQYGAAANPSYRKFVMRERDRLGADSDEFRMSYLLEWPLVSGMLFDMKLWALMCGDGEAGRPQIVQGGYTPGKPKVYGLDIAKHSDATVLTIGEDWGDHLRIIDWVYLSKTDYEDQYEIIKSVVDSVGKGTMVVDSTGAGDPVTERLQRIIGYDLIIPLAYSAQSKDRLCKLVKTESQAGRLFYPGKVHDLPSFRRFEKECLECEVETRGNLLTFHHPLDRDSGHHDDYVDSLANMVYGAREVAASVSQYQSMPL